MFDTHDRAYAYLHDAAVYVMLAEMFTDPQLAGLASFIRVMYEQAPDDMRPQDWDDFRTWSATLEHLVEDNFWSRTINLPPWLSHIISAWQDHLPHIDQEREPDIESWLNDLFCLMQLLLWLKSQPEVTKG